MKAKNLISFLLVIVLIAVFSYVALFDFKIGNIEVPSTFDKEKGIKQGLDLVGGSIIVFEPDVKDLSKVTSEDMGSAESIIRARLDAAGYNEATISRQGETGIRIEIPNIDDPQEAVEMIGATAKLEFLDADGKAIMDGSKKYISGAKSIYGPISETSGNVYYVQLSFKKDGQAKFKEATEKAVAAMGDNKNFISIALDGNIQKVSNGIFLIAPYNVGIMGDFKDELRNTGIFPWSK